MHTDIMEPSRGKKREDPILVASVCIVLMLLSKQLHLTDFKETNLKLHLRLSILLS
jgi:hypothetical protein